MAFNIIKMAKKKQTNKKKPHQKTKESKQKKKVRPQHHNLDCLTERGVGEESGPYSTLKGRVRSLLNQTKIGTVSRGEPWEGC